MSPPIRIPVGDAVACETITGTRGKGRWGEVARLITVTTVSYETLSVFIPMDVRESICPLLRADPGSPTIWSGLGQVGHSLELFSSTGITGPRARLPAVSGAGEEPSQTMAG